MFTGIQSNMIFGFVTHGGSRGVAYMRWFGAEQNSPTII